ncbi:hypothetical protein, partial [Virgibacillus halodenitrificans]|uniref:hypothetical protein n=1 Tax=Virgibacillus halodenitrificans TaxID=1482 RepID=UPI001C43C22E
LHADAFTPPGTSATSVRYLTVSSLPPGMASAASSATLRAGSSPHAIPAGAPGQQDVGHAIVATNVFGGTS